MTMQGANTTKPRTFIFTLGHRFENVMLLSLSLRFAVLTTLEDIKMGLTPSGKL